MKHVTYIASSIVVYASLLLLFGQLLAVTVDFGACLYERIGNKDSLDWTRLQPLSESDWLFSVADGHGKEGLLASHKLTLRLGQKATHSYRLDKTVDLPGCIAKIEQDELEAIDGGTTIAAALIEHDCLTALSAGDSLMVLGRRNGDEIEAHQLFAPHTIENETERQRMALAASNPIMPCCCGTHLTTNECVVPTWRCPQVDDTCQHMDGIFVRGNWIPYTRSIGDAQIKRALYEGYGGEVVSSVPEMVQYSLDSNDQFLILATKGVWCKLSPDQAVAWVAEAFARHEKAQEVVDDLVAVVTEMGTQEVNDVLYGKQKTYLGHDIAVIIARFCWGEGG